MAKAAASALPQKRSKKKKTNVVEIQRKWAFSEPQLRVSGAHTRSRSWFESRQAHHNKINDLLGPNLNAFNPLKTAFRSGVPAACFAR